MSHLSHSLSHTRLLAYSYQRSTVSHAKPLHDLTSPGVKFHWTDTCQQSFEIPKTMLCQSPVLAYPSREGKFVLDTDASDFGIGGVLSQIQDGREHVIAYASRCLFRSERKYCTTRKEILAVKFCLEYFHHYLCGRHFLLRTNHAAIRWMLEKPVVQGQYARWLTVLSIEHRPGNRHSNADGLSRIPCRQCGRDNMCEVAQKVENDILASDDGPSTCAITWAGAHRDPAPVSKHQH